MIFQEILKKIALVCRRCEVKANCVMPFLQLVLVIYYTNTHSDIHDRYG